VRTVLALLLAGLDAAQLSRLADLRIRAQRGAFADDGCPGDAGERPDAGRAAFARWLVRTGRLHEGHPGGLGDQGDPGGYP
jgi:hypothetical protein